MESNDSNYDYKGVSYKDLVEEIRNRVSGRDVINAEIYKSASVLIIECVFLKISFQNHYEVLSLREIEDDFPGTRFLEFIQAALEEAVPNCTCKVQYKNDYEDMKRKMIEHRKHRQTLIESWRKEGISLPGSMKGMNKSMSLSSIDIDNDQLQTDNEFCDDGSKNKVDDDWHDKWLSDLNEMTTANLNYIFGDDRQREEEERLQAEENRKQQEEDDWDSRNFDSLVVH